jgi:predicted PurR-regulated permease PerM
MPPLIAAQTTRQKPCELLIKLLRYFFFFATFFFVAFFFVAFFFATFFFAFFFAIIESPPFG